MYVHAYQSYVWNAIVSERIRTYGAERPIAGDLVFDTSPEEDVSMTDVQEGDVPAADEVEDEAGALCKLVTTRLVQTCSIFRGSVFVAFEQAIKTTMGSTSGEDAHRRRFGQVHDIRRDHAAPGNQRRLSRRCSRRKIPRISSHGRLGPG
jgi:tRNA(Glu) U13 pseudouridine synthase TruD